MEQATDTPTRLTNLEIKASFTEDLLDQLEQIIVRQQRQIDALVLEISHLRQPLADSGAGAPRNLRDELPPHF
jgi:SlyX protein